MEELELKQYFAIFMRWLWLIILGAVLAAGAAYVVSASMPPVYQATATLFVSQPANPSSPVGLDYSSLLGSERLAKTYGELIKKRPILQEVVESLDLRDDKGNPMSPERLASSVDVKPVRDTQLINVAVEHTDPAMAAIIANKLTEVFIRQSDAMQMARFAASKQNLEKQLATLDQEIKETQKALEAARAAAAGAGQQQAEVIRLENLIAAYKNSYASILKSYEDLRLTEARTVNNIIVAEPAQVPEKPVRPNKVMNTLLAGAVGMMLAVGTAFLIEYLDDTIKTPERLNQALGVTALGTIGRMPSTEKEPDRLIAAAHPKSHIAEAYRVLRANLQFAGVTRPLHSILVTSAGPGEGKSTTVANLGVVLAQAGKRVILVDSDMRRPSLHKFFEIPNTAGLTNLLLQDDPRLDGYIADTKIENLRVITSGPLPPNPSELLGSQRMKHLAEMLKGEADIVLFDSPPILPVVDAMVLSSIVDGVMLVVDTNTRRDALARAGAALAQAGANVVGAALNKLRLGRGSGYYYYYYYYYTPEGERKRRRRDRGDAEDAVSRLSWLDRLLKRSSADM